MKVPFNDLAEHHAPLRTSIDQAIAKVLDSSAFIRGPQVGLFEREFAEAIGAAHCIGCGNGTDALYLALRALGVGPGDEVIVPAMTWISTSETVTQVGADVVFCDVDERTYTLDPQQVEKRITDRTKAIIPVHLYGHPADMHPLLRIARAHRLRVIEDCAQAHLATEGGQYVGTIGDVSTFSFFPGKNLGAMGDAGCVVTHDAGLAEQIRLLGNHGGKGEHVVEGINSRLDTLQAAILSVKLPHLRSWTDARRQVAARYDEKLLGCGDLILPSARAGAEPVYHLYVIQTEQRDALRDFLQEAGVQTGVHYPTALPYLPAYSRFEPTPHDFPTSYRTSRRILSLPIFPEMTVSQIDYVVDRIHDFFAND